MTTRHKKTSIVLATSAVLTAGLALSPTLVSADTNPFASTELSSGYMQLAEGNCGANKNANTSHKVKKEGKCGEAKCGANKKRVKADKAKEGKCGANRDKAANHKGKKEGKCGEAKCGANKKKAEGKCGEAKCGAKKIDKSFFSNNPSYTNSMGK